jgi:ABC-2 type transport system permease protein
MGHQIALLKRELWEHRSIFVTPIAIASIVTLGTIAMIVFASGFASELDIVIFGATNVARDAERSIALTVFFIGTSWLFVVATGILTIFYTLDSLYAERKDKSILFWRSLPVTDAEAVISKLFTAIVLIPLIAFAAIVVTHLVNLTITSIWVSTRGADAGHLIWGSIPLFSDWLGALVFLIASSIWMSPFVGWFLLVSAFTKRSPLLMAFLPMVLISLAEIIILRSHYFFNTVFNLKMPLFGNMDASTFFDEERLLSGDRAMTLLDQMSIVQFVSSPTVWGGIAVCALFTTAAIYVRRYRDES